MINSTDNNDFGFTSSVNIDDNDILTITQLYSRLAEIRELILPLLDNLIDTSDTPVIKWPNRKEPLLELKQKILQLTAKKENKE